MSTIATEVVRRTAFDLRCSGATLEQISTHLAMLGIQTSTGRPLWPSAVHRLLRREAMLEISSGGGWTVRVWPDREDRRFEQRFRCASIREARDIERAQRRQGARVVVMRLRSRAAVAA